MFKIGNYHISFEGIGETSYPMEEKNLHTGRFLDDEHIIVDVRDLKDEWNPPIKYAKKFCQIDHYQDFIFDDVAVCCGAGMSRSASVVLGYLIFKGKTWDEAWELVHSKGSPAQIEPGHIRALKELFGMYENFTFQGKKGEIQK